MVDLAIPIHKGASMIRSRSMFVLAGLAVASLAATACSSGGGGTSAASGTNPSTTAAGTGQPSTVGVAHNALGNILVDSQGRTLYLFQKDSGMTSACSGSCASAWPPLRSTAAPTAGNGADGSKLATTPRSDGDPQVTYNGHPLYTYVNDTKGGDANGQGVNAFGALWFVLSPAGMQVSGSQSSSSGSGSGY
jgi:predicted lipoprotein with Yx(FWY)xxD motif